MSQHTISRRPTEARTRRNPRSISPADTAFVAMRAILEAGVVAALATWGVAAGDGLAAEIGLGIAAPLIGFGFWGAVDFHQAGRWAEPLRLAQELVVSAVAAIAWYAAGQHTLGWMLAALSVAYHLLVPLTGRRLLKSSPSHNA